MEFSVEIIGLLFFVALVAGFIDAIAGGGGLITIPALLMTGMSPALALGTNKLQACGGSFSASLYPPGSRKYTCSLVVTFNDFHWSNSRYDIDSAG